MEILDIELELLRDFGINLRSIFLENVDGHMKKFTFVKGWC
jgi:hypothetical protein